MSTFSEGQQVAIALVGGGLLAPILSWVFYWIGYSNKNRFVYYQCISGTLVGQACILCGTNVIYQSVLLAGIVLLEGTMWIGRLCNTNDNYVGVPETHAEEVIEDFAINPETGIQDSMMSLTNLNSEETAEKQRIIQHNVKLKSKRFWVATVVVFCVVPVTVYNGLRLVTFAPSILALISYGVNSFFLSLCVFSALSVARILTIEKFKTRLLWWLGATLFWMCSLLGGVVPVFGGLVPVGTAQMILDSLPFNIVFYLFVGVMFKCWDYYSSLYGRLQLEKREAAFGFLLFFACASQSVFVGFWLQ